MVVAGRARAAGGIGGLLGSSVLSMTSIIGRSRRAVGFGRAPMRGSVWLGWRRADLASRGGLGSRVPRRDCSREYLHINVSRKFIPCTTIKDASGLFLVDATPLLEMECDLRIETLVSNASYPI